jgi:hypothetical protein
LQRANELKTYVAGVAIDPQGEPAIVNDQQALIEKVHHGPLG